MSAKSLQKHGSTVSRIDKDVAITNYHGASTMFGRGLRLEPDPQEHVSSWGWIVDHPVFKHSVDAIILFNLLQMGVSLELRGSDWEPFWKFGDIFATAVFFAEMVVCVCAKRWVYFQSNQNIIDFGIAWFGVLDILLQVILQSENQIRVIQVFRVVRLARIAKLLRIFPAFGVILHSMTASLTALFWLLLFLCIVLYAVGIGCVILIGGKDSGYPAYSPDESKLVDEALGTFNNFKYFGTLWRSTLTLFNLTLMSEVDTILRAVSSVQPWASCFIALFIMVMSLCILNTIIGVIVDKTVSAVLFDEGSLDRARKRQCDAIAEIAELMFELDEDENAEISLTELKQGSQNPVLQHLLREIDLPAGFSVEELFNMLDTDYNGIVTRTEFIGGMFRLVYSNEFQRECLARVGETYVKHCVRSMKDEIIQEMRQENDKLLHEVKQMMCSVFSKVHGSTPCENDAPDACISTCEQKTTHANDSTKLLGESNPDLDEYLPCEHHTEMFGIYTAVDVNREASSAAKLTKTGNVQMSQQPDWSDDLSAFDIGRERCANGGFQTSSCWQSRKSTAHHNSSLRKGPHMCPTPGTDTSPATDRMATKPHAISNDGTFTYI